MKAFVTYTLARLGLFLGAYALLWAIAWFWLEFTTLTNLLVMFLALVISAVAAIFLLGGLRDNLARNIEQRADRMSKRIEESRSAEDVD